MNKCTENEFKDYCIKKETGCIKKREILQIFTTFATLLEDQLRNLTATQVNKTSDICLIFKECVNIIDYINNCFKKLSKTLKKTVPQIVILKDIFDLAINPNKSHSKETEEWLIRGRIYIDRSCGPFLN